MFFRQPTPISHYPTKFSFNKQTFVLHCDPDLFAAEYPLLLTLLDHWFLQEIQLFNRQDAAENCLAQELRYISPVLMGHHITKLGRIFQDTETDSSAQRFFDLVLRIHSILDQRVLSVLQGRFYYHLLYTLAPTPQIQIPDRAHLEQLARTYPWIWLIGPYQQATDRHSMRVSEIHVTDVRDHAQKV